MPTGIGLVHFARVLAAIWALCLGVGPAAGQVAGDGLIMPSPTPPPLPSPLIEPTPISRPSSSPSPIEGVELSPRSGSAIEVKLGQGRFLTFKDDLAQEDKPAPFLAVGDPSVVDFFQVGPRQLRLIGKSLGSTDLTVTDSTGRSYDFEVRVVADLDPLRAMLRQSFPDASLNLLQLREKIVVEGQARDATQVGRIIATIETFFKSVRQVQIPGQVANKDEKVLAPNPEGVAVPPLPVEPIPSGLSGGALLNTPAAQGGGASGQAGLAATYTVGQIVTNQPQVINLIRVPSSQQVLLKVRVAELNRTGFRQIGADLLGIIPQFSTLLGTQIAGNALTPGQIGASTFQQATTAGRPLANLALGSQATAFGTFSHGQFNVILTALRRNSLVKILAEPNLVALNGHQANFLAGGEFPVPSFSGVGAGAPGGGGASTTQFKEFGVRLAFLPIIVDGDTVRLTVDPEVSTVDTTLATTLVPGGSPVPGLNVRKSHTTVELRQGDTLAIAGLMQLDLAGNTQKIPLLGDLPYIGTFFSNTSSNRVEKELIVLVTPYIIEPMPPGQVPPVPGDEVSEPNDLEFFFLNRIEGRTGIDGRSSTSYDDPLHLVRSSLVEKRHLIGPSGFSK
ncbi:pilus assembly protein N-terminal domain-containing protein [Isosphaeraceae bacterium EP7]